MSQKYAQHCVAAANSCILASPEGLNVPQMWEIISLKDVQDDRSLLVAPPTTLLRPQGAFEEFFNIFSGPDFLVQM